MPSFDSASYPVLPVVANVSAEPVFIITMNLFNLCIFGLYFAESKPKELRNTVLLAFVCGLGLATKINFLIILLAGLLIIPLRKKLLFVIVCLMSFVFCTLPIIGKYPQLFDWVSDMVRHSSRYGTGSEKFIDWKSFFFYVRLMVSSDWFFIFSALGLWVWSSIGMIKNRQQREARFVWVLTACLLLHIAATAKHFSFHYLLPGFAMFGSIFPLFYLSQQGRYKLFKALIAVFILIFTGTCLYYSVVYFEKLHVLTQDIRYFNKKLNTNYPECTIIPATTGDVDLFLTKEMVLQRANGTAFRLEGDDLLRLYPHNYYFFSEEVTSPDPNVESYGIWDFKQRIWGRTY